MASGRSPKGFPKKPDVEAATLLQPKLSASGFLELNRSEERALGLRHRRPSPTGSRRSAARRATHEGPDVQRWPEPAVSRGTAEAGWFERVREGGRRDKSG